MKIIKIALINHYKRWGFLPCPAEGHADIIDTNYGVGLGTNSIGAACTGNVFTASSGANTVYIGVVPFKNLGLPPDYMTDIWSNRIMYIVQKDAIYAGGTFTYVAGPTPPLSDATMLVANKYISPLPYDISTYADSDDRHTNQAKFVLISHGPSATGAYRYYGGTDINDRNRGILSSATNTNHHISDSNAYTRVFLKPTEYIADFDDLVEYWDDPTPYTP